jgi:hypothetical protein
VIDEIKDGTIWEDMNQSFMRLGPVQQIRVSVVLLLKVEL